jgi:hypothetical protein
MSWTQYPLAGDAYGFDIFNSAPTVPIDVGFSRSDNDATLKTAVWDCVISGFILRDSGSGFPVLNGQFSSTHGTLTPVGPSFIIPLLPNAPFFGEASIGEVNPITHLDSSGDTFDLSGDDVTFNGAPGGGTHEIDAATPPNSQTSSNTGAVTLFVWFSEMYLLL